MKRLFLVLVILSMPLAAGCADDTDTDAGNRATEKEPPKKETRKGLTACLRDEDIDVERRDADTVRLTASGDFARIKRLPSVKEAAAFAKQLDPNFIEATTLIGRQIVTYDSNDTGEIPEAVEKCSGRPTVEVRQARVAPPRKPKPPSPPEPKPSSPPPPPPEPEPAAECHPDYGGCLDPNAADYDCEGGSGDGPKYTGPVESKGSDPFDLDRDDDGTGCNSS